MGCLSIRHQLGIRNFEESGISFTDRIPDNIDRWVDSGLVTIPPVINGKIQAEAIDGSENLILLYVEALTTSVITHEEYEDLMPGFRDLLNEHALIDDIYTSSHVTIEGIANTQCGLLFPFRGHGSGFAGREMLAEALPCLGDVLAAAGYHQKAIFSGAVQCHLLVRATFWQLTDSMISGAGSTGGREDSPAQQVTGEWVILKPWHRFDN